MKKVGTVTTAVGLLTLGLILVLARIYPRIEWFSNPLKWWPVLLISLGLEIIVRRIAYKEVEMKIDPLIVLFLLGVFLSSIFNLAREEIMASGVLGWKYVFNKHYEDNVSASGVNSIDVDVQEGSVRLLPAADGQLHVSTDLRLNSNHKAAMPESVFTISRNGERLVLRVAGDDWPSSTRVKSLKTIIYLPPVIPVSVEPESELEARDITNPLVVESSGGCIDAANLASSLDIRSDSGEVHVGHIRGSVQIRNDGPVTVSDISSDLRLSVKNGAVKLDEVYGNIDAYADYGVVQLNNYRGIAKNCRIQTQQATIDLSVGKIVDCKFAAATTGGLNLPSYLNLNPAEPPNSKNPEENRSVQVVVGKGSKNVELVSLHGPITVR